MNVYSKAGLVLLIAVSAFNLGRYSVAFIGSAAGWASLVLWVICLAVCVFALLFSNRKAAN